MFTAWRRWLELIAEQGPTVLVFEDLHWADEALLAFLEHLADRAEGVPLMIVGTTRPELFEQHPDFGGRLRNTNAVNLAPLSSAETARLVSALLDASVMPAELQQPILDRAGGNPLYAEEFVRLLNDKELLVRKGSSWELREGAEVPFPDSVRALIAARLDTLTPDAKSLLADAAVVGKVFWAGAVAAMGERDSGMVVDMLRDLSRKELVRSSRRSSMEGESEYAFWHILTRDVAYNQLPRASRASRHVAAANWIEAQAPTRAEDHADVLAYHYAIALDLARASGQTDQAATLEDPARRFLTLAGQRALGLDTTAALTNLERALALTPKDHPDRPDVLVSFAEAAHAAARHNDAKEALEQAMPALQERGDITAEAHAMNRLGDVLFVLADPRWAELPREALALLEPLPPGPGLVEAFSGVASVEALQGRPRSAISAADRALTLADQLGIDRPARALGYRGYARCGQGDAGGLDDLREAIRLATQAGQGRDVALLHNNLGVALWSYKGPQAAIVELRTGIAYATARGVTGLADFMTAGMLSPLFDTGQLDEALTLAIALSERIHGDQIARAEFYSVAARSHTLRGQATQAAGYLDWLETTTRDVAHPEPLAFGLGAAAITHTALGNTPRAAILLSEIAAARHARDTVYYASLLPALVRTAITLNQPNIAQQLTTDHRPNTPYAHHTLVAVTAILAEAHGDYQTAAEGYANAAHQWEQFGVMPEQAYALQGHGRTLITLRRSAEAAPILHKARDLFTQLDAAPAITETDLLLQHATALSS